MQDFTRNFIACRRDSLIRTERSIPDIHYMWCYYSSDVVCFIDVIYDAEIPSAVISVVCAASFVTSTQRG